MQTSSNGWLSGRTSVMDTAAWAAVGGTGVAALSAVFAGIQILYSRRQATTSFEDALTAEYRALLRELPIKALLAGGMSKDEIVANLSLFYWYFDLCNEQAFLASEKRITPETWKQWSDGIESNMRRQAFRDAWQIHIRDEASVSLPSGDAELDVNELRSFLSTLDLDKPIGTAS